MKREIENESGGNGSTKITKVEFEEQHENLSSSQGSFGAPIDKQ